MKKNFNHNISLLNLLYLVDYKAHAIAGKKDFNEKGNVIHSITAKKLMSGDYPVIAEYCSGNSSTYIHFIVFSNGFCLFEAEDRCTIFDIVKFVLNKKVYITKFEKEIDGAPSSCEFSIKQLLMENWIFALIEYAEDRITNNLMNDIASRPGHNINEVPDNDDGDYMEIDEIIADLQMVNPAEEIIFAESIEESLNTLTDKQKIVLVSTILEDRTDQEVADMLGVERSAVTYRKNRAIKRIRENQIWD